MAEYIELEALKKRFAKRLDWLKKDIHDEYSGALYDCCEVNADLIDEIPTADVAPVVHSYWEHKIINDGENIGICHNCKYPVSWFWEQAKYCPNCGAKMDGGADHAAG